jgi:hypothetical protein
MPATYRAAGGQSPWLCSQCAVPCRVPKSLPAAPPPALPGQDHSLLCRAQEPSQAGGALCVLLTPSHVISGWGDGSVRCHARAGGGGAAPPAWTIAGAHAFAHARGVTALALPPG